MATRQRCASPGQRPSSTRHSHPHASAASTREHNQRQPTRVSGKHKQHPTFVNSKLCRLHGTARLCWSRAEEAGDGRRATGTGAHSRTRTRARARTRRVTRLCNRHTLCCTCRLCFPSLLRPALLLLLPLGLLLFLLLQRKLAKSAGGRYQARQRVTRLARDDGGQPHASSSTYTPNNTGDTDSGVEHTHARRQEKRTTRTERPVWGDDASPRKTRTETPADRRLLHRTQQRAACATV